MSWLENDTVVVLLCAVFIPQIIKEKKLFIVHHAFHVNVICCYIGC